MEKKIAHVISGLLHPMVMPFFTLLIIISLNTYISFVLTPAGKRILLGLVFTTTFMLPMSLIVLLSKKSLLKSLEMSERQERTIPYLITAIFYYVTFEMLKKFYLPDIIYSILLGAAFTAVVALFINLKWKISAHMIGIGGLIGALAALSRILMLDIHHWIMFLILIAGIIGSARLLLKAHTPMQIYAGFLTGFCLMLLTVMIQS
ncbi:MAG: hypothetical protein KKA07_08280 [Bacteroidetes bacterium]|nr:hypothetical protein [Bacteroidota bacterium]MBU1719057.1 hypothetical protein [Bacteroidota bacterium]